MEPACEASMWLQLSSHLVKNKLEVGSQKEPNLKLSQHSVQTAYDKYIYQETRSYRSSVRIIYFLKVISI